MGERFFLEQPPRDGRATLVGDEARHLGRVLRGRVGDEVVVFDGSGVCWPARITAVHRDEIMLAVAAPLLPEPCPQPPLVLAVALPKGERQKWLVEKITELGCAALVPLVTVRGVAEATPAAAERLLRTALEACKQSGRTVRLEIEPPLSVADLVARRIGGSRLVVAHPAAGPVPADVGTAAEIVTVVGPEGGLAPEELALLDAAGGTRIGLGPHVLRVETAAVAAAARLVGSRQAQPGPHAG